MQIPSTPLTQDTPRVQRATDKPVTAPSSQSPQSVSDVIERYDFEKMTVGEFCDAISELIFAGRISVEDCLDINSTIIPPFPPPGMSHEEYMAMPMNISLDRIREDIKYAGKEHRLADRDMYQRVLDFLEELQGTPRRIDTTA
jgi:hypothetical protein